MHLVQQACGTKYVNAQNWGQPIGEVLNVSSVKTIRVLIKKRIGIHMFGGCGMLKNFKGPLTKK
jgi:hypothetical protein